MDGRTAGGGGAAFEAFLRQDLKPFIEARFPADPTSSVLLGHSLGGVFAANVFAHQPDAFAGYIIGSVVIPRSPGLVERVRQAAARAHGQRVFLAVGGAEDVTIAEKLDMLQGFTQMKAAFDQPGVVLEAKLYPGENHISYCPELVIDGFRFTLPPNARVDRPYVTLPEATIARYVGAYRLPDGRELVIKTANEGRLSAQIDGASPVPLLPNGADRYYAPTADLDVVFDARGLTMMGRGATARAERAS